MKFVAIFLILIAQLSCSPRKNYTSFVQEKPTRELDGYDWIVIGDTNGGYETEKMVEILRKDAWRVEWFRNPATFRQRPRAQGYLMGMRSILLVGDAVSILPEIDPSPRDLVLMLPRCAPTPPNKRFRVWRKALVLEPEPSETSYKQWLEWSKEHKFEVVECTKELAGSHETWERIFAAMDVAANKVSAELDRQREGDKPTGSGR